jgi:transposase
MQQLNEERHRVPLKLREAQWHAAKLRKRYGSKLTYGAIALLMGEYHGQWYSAHYWRDVCRRRGCEPAHARGYAAKQRSHV